MKVTTKEKQRYKPTAKRIIDKTKNKTKLYFLQIVRMLQ